MYSISEYKKAKCANKNVAVKISHNKYKDDWMNKKQLRHSVNRIQSKNHKIGTYEIKKIYLFCFDDFLKIMN